MSDYRALYRKWRPRDFDDVSGQAAVTNILKYEVANGKLSHAYLFCGSRGTGKTSCAKILAKAVNCENPINGNPCNRCEACRSIDAGVSTDVIEMDAASNNGVNDVRDMKDEIAFTPALLKYRVYIVDEVHMMSSAAFNALLKTLEEPPAYVIFILATTELHKLPTTIVSRCQRFDFKRIAQDSIVDRLMQIAEGEGIALTDDGARVISRVSRGGMRDAISLLELCAGAGNRIDAQTVFTTVGTGSRDTVYGLIKAIKDKNYDVIYSTAYGIVMNSGDISVFWQELIDSYRDIMVVKNTDKAKEYLDLTDSEYEFLSELARSFTPSMLAYHVSILESALADMQRSFNAKRSVAEIALTRMCDARSSVTLESLCARIEELEREISVLKLGMGGQKQIVGDETAVKVLPKIKFIDKISDSKSDSSAASEDKPAVKHNEGKTVVYDKWQSVIERIGQLRSRLSGQFSGSVAFRMKDGSFLIRMASFFAEKISSSNDDLLILRGAIAEREGIPSDDVRIVIEPREAMLASDLERELEEAINNANQN